MAHSPFRHVPLCAFVVLAVTRGMAHADQVAPVDASVYRISPSLDGAVIAAASLGALAPAVFESALIKPRCPCDPKEVNRFDRGVIGNHNDTAGLVSDVTVGLTFVAPLIADRAALGSSRALLEDAVVFAETLAVNAFFVNLTKYITQRPLPRVYAGEHTRLTDSPGGYRAFYSGHTSFAFAALGSASMTIGWRYGLWVAPWVATAAIGTSVAVERVAAGRHFYTDVIVGAAAGTAVGIAVPWLHRRPSARPTGFEWRPALYAQPSPRVGVMGRF